jgi:hypothetical protein
VAVKTGLSGALTKPTPAQENRPEAPARSRAPRKEEEGRGDRRGILCRLTPAQRRSVREYCFQRDVTLQDMMLRGLDLVLKAEGMRSLPDFTPPS